MSRSRQRDQKSEPNDCFLGDTTSLWRGHEGLKWVDSGGSIVVPRMAGIGAEETAASEIAMGPPSRFLAQPLRSTRPTNSMRVPGGKRFQETIVIPPSSALQASPLESAWSRNDVSPAAAPRELFVQPGRHGDGK